MKTFALAALLAAQLAAPSPASAQDAMLRGSAILKQMHDTYDGKWYKTLTFNQRTIIVAASGKVDTSTWYESLSGPARLRIDQGSPSLGNGTLYTADSTTSVRNGAVTGTRAGGNVFLPLIMGVYLQPLAETERQVRAFKFELSRSVESTYQGHNVLIVGASIVTDSTSPQFWVDTDRLVVLRARGQLFGAGLNDIDLGGYEKVGPAWLATRVTIATGARRQIEEYYDWKANVPLAEALFDPKQWTTAPHWAK